LTGNQAGPVSEVICAAPDAVSVRHFTNR